MFSLTWQLISNKNVFIYLGIIISSLCALFVWHGNAMSPGLCGLCSQVQVLRKEHLVYWWPFLAWEKVSFCLSFTRCNYPWISKDCCGIIDGKWRFNITNERKWVECGTACAFAAEETPQSPNPGWAGQLWLWGESHDRLVHTSWLHIQSASPLWPPLLAMWPWLLLNLFPSFSQ